MKIGSVHWITGLHLDAAQIADLDAIETLPHVCAKTGQAAEQVLSIRVSLRKSVVLFVLEAVTAVLFAQGSGLDVKQTYAGQHLPVGKMMYLNLPVCAPPIPFDTSAWRLKRLIWGAIAGLFGLGGLVVVILGIETSGWLVLGGVVMAMLALGAVFVNLSNARFADQIAYEPAPYIQTVLSRDKLRFRVMGLHSAFLDAYEAGFTELVDTSPTYEMRRDPRTDLYSARLDFENWTELVVAASVEELRDLMTDLQSDGP